MKKVKINYSEQDYQSFITDLKSYEENLVRLMRMNNNALDFKLKAHMKNDDIDEWIETLQKILVRAESLKSLKRKVRNHAEIELTDNEYLELIRCLWEEIEHGKDRLDDYKSRRFSWGEKMIPVEKADIVRRIALYEKLEGKPYILNHNSVI